MSRVTRSLVFAAAIAVTALAWIGARSGVAVRLVNGDTIEAEDVRREGPDYVLTMPDGSTMVLPVDAVDAVGLSGTGEREDRPRDDTPEGLTYEEPRDLAGTSVRQPRQAEQLAVFGEQRGFQQDIVENRWRPETDWNMDPRTQNNWAPSQWSDGPIDPNWTPEPAWEDRDVLEDGRSTWSKSVVDSSWTPQDGFAR